jgi:phosphoenolpyruvate carboxylase
MRDYSMLVADVDLRERFMGLIFAELERTRSLIEDLFASSFANRRPRFAYTLDIREEALAVLHRQQIGLLTDWRAKIHAGNTDAAEAMLPDLMISINALASGLRTTG